MVVLKSHLLLVPTVSFAFTSPAATRQPPTAFAPLGPSRAAHGRSARTLAAASRRAASVHRCTMVAAPASAAREGDLMGCLRAGIKAVAVGVKGSKPIPDELVPQILAALETLDGASGAELEPARQRLASFLGTLFVKHDIAESDAVVLTAVAQRRPQLAGEGRSRGGCSSAQLLSVACGDGAASAELLRLCRALLDGEVLSAGEAEALGRRLYDSNEPAAARTLAAHVLRVRYETREEFAGLLRAQASTVDRQAFDLANLALVYAQRRIVQLAEPFDGVDRSPLLTPLIARHLQRRWRALAVTQVRSGQHAMGKEVHENKNKTTPVKCTSVLRAGCGACLVRGKRGRRVRAVCCRLLCCQGDWWHALLGTVRLRVLGVVMINNWVMS
eukprot:TRINITY_DN4542_c0_g1_i2.p1 TRINITY_DN4542_c0_g1~~TRINITY_DN4542_c0_g1_i2.p1  ORF type:complete len:388 (+),score=101.77 TRINITY_DN4542_c0_g1_i2:99-1262(+)